MIYDRILVRYGDLTLKGRNQKMFLTKVQNLTKNKLKDLDVKVDCTHSRIYIMLNGVDYKEVLKRLDRVSGLSSYSLVCRCDSNIDSINDLALKLVKETITKNVSFKVECKRADKTFPLTSLEVPKITSAHILKNTNNLTVDVHNPDVTLTIEIRSEGTFMYTEEIKAMGGFPVGVAGRGLVMMSGGIDSPVAAYLAMKQGIEVEIIHFESTPLTSIESAQKVIDLTKKLAVYAPNNKIKVYMIPFMKMHQALLDYVDESYNITIMRRMMYRIASRLANMKEILCLINGESVGQVASQTLDSMHVINSVTNIPVLRPLVTYDKNDIIKISRHIDCFDISIKPFEDCCTVYVPKNPVIKPNIKKCEEMEAKFDFEEIINWTLNNTKYLVVNDEMDINLASYGLEVGDVIDEIVTKEILKK
ncbi:MAG: tRNA 4-thiouridine(8) synthase ThiI [Acholeplasmatales bacterium]|nr:tRNA 4-thiouridine(8) synthase ThiI [Acholeplasmatales bacterium]